MEFEFETQQEYFRDKVANFDDQPDKVPKFLRFGAAAIIFHNTQKLRKRVFPLLAIGDDIEDSEKERIARKILNSPNLHTLLLIILCCGNLTVLSFFRQQFLGKESGTDGPALPLEFNDVQRLFGVTNAKEIYDGQFAFTPFVLEEGVFRATCPPSQLMPYWNEEELGEGNYGKVYKVKIQRGHFIGRSPRTRNMDPIFLARKDFGMDDFEAFKNEDRVLKEFSETSNCHSSIMTSVGSVIKPSSIGKNPASSIFFPAAKCNLYDYITDQANVPTSEYLKLRNIANMLDVCEGLKWLSNSLVYLPREDTYTLATYYHMDLKPQNVLVCDSRSGDQDSVTFKIADFGETKDLKRRRTGERPEELKSAFGGRREATYLAPEAQEKPGNDNFKGDKSDVWPFGCILLLVLLFNEYGAKGIVDFGTRRRKCYPKVVSDRFFWIEYDKIIVNRAVDEVIQKMLTHRKGGRRGRDKAVLEKSLQYLKCSVLVPYRQRDSINDVSIALHGYYNERTPLDPVDDRIRDRVTPADWKHSMHSPDGKYVFLYSSERISIHTTDAKYSDEIPQPVSAERWSSRVVPHSPSCAERAICLVPKHNSSRDNFELTVHYLPPNLSGETAIAQQVLKIPGLRAERVDKVALSPDGAYIAVALDVIPDGNDRTTQLRMYEISSLTGLTRSSSHSSLSGSTDRSTVSSHQSVVDCKDIFKSQCKFTGASHNIMLRFSRCGRNQVLYFAYRKKKPTGLDSDVSVRLFKADSGDALGSVTVPNKCRLDHGDDIYFTSLTPLNTEPGFLVVTHKRQIWRWTKTERLTGPAVPSGVQNIQKLLISQDDKRVVLLCTNNKRLEVYLATPKDLIDPTRVEYELHGREKLIKSQNPEQDSGSLYYDEAGNLKLLFMSFDSKTSYTFELGSTLTTAER